MLAVVAQVTGLKGAYRRNTGKQTPELTSFVGEHGPKKIAGRTATKQILCQISSMLGDRANT